MNADERTFEKLFELSGDAMMLSNHKGFVHCNDTTLKMFHCTDRNIFTSMHPSEVSPPLQPDGQTSTKLAREHIATALQEGHHRFEWIHRRLNGEDFYADVQMSPARWKGQDVIQAIVRDISQHKKLEAELRQAKEEAESLSLAKSEFFAMMSHEIRTPIHGIISAQELLLGSGINNDQRENIELTLNSAKSLLHTLNDLLDFSKIEAGQFSIVNESISPKEVAKGVFDLFSSNAAKKNLKYSLDYPEKGPAFLLADGDRIRQILLNLLGNAIKFTEQGSVTMSCTFTPIENGNIHWVTRISDTGIGLTPQQQKNIFDKFTQADSSISRQYGGTGLGLTISQALAKLMHGDISVSSNEQQGATFTLSLVLETSSKTTPTQAVTPDSLHRNYQRHILLVEDNPVNQTLIRKHLHNLGISTDLAADGLEALAAVHRENPQRYDLILMDIQMPNMNGIDTSRQLRTEGCRIPIVALSADVISERRTACLKAGMNKFLTKPFILSDLVKLLDTFFKNEPEL